MSTEQQQQPEETPSNLSLTQHLHALVAEELGDQTVTEKEKRMLFQKYGIIDPTLTAEELLQVIFEETGNGRN